ncbi:MAG TPA: 4-alpha-glucanotransferase [Acidimicrobiales bacterium]|nr:4-alpha-glucanotransferase [Acidimicrobiales bacterium]
MIVEPRYRDWKGEWRDVNPDTLKLVRDLVDEHPANAAAYEVANASPRHARRCVVPGERRLGLAVQVYSLWSDDSAGIGDLGDVATLARASGADFLLLSPLHAPAPGFPQSASPYFPSSRQYRNPLHLRVDGVRLPNDPAAPIDRDAVWRAKLSALETEFAAFGGDPAFETYCALEGDDLVRYATFVDAANVGFHQWIQWRIDEQLRDAASAGAGLVHDIAVGFDPAGADASMWRDQLAEGMHIGAPPDEFNTAGQDWGLPPFVPDKLAAAHYRPIEAALEAAAAHGAGLRVDHVMGLFRLFWIPDGADPADGVYVRYPAAELLDVVAAVSQRRGVFVVGEDLGTVEPGVREALAARGILSYKVLSFEDEAPRAWPRLSLASAGTHDLPTLTAKGEDVEEVHARLRDANSVLVVFTAEDVLGMTEQPTHPGTDDPWNWSRRLPVAVDRLANRFAEQ